MHADAVYILGTLSGSGTYGFMFEKPKPVPALAAGSLEAELLAQSADYAFISLKHDAPGWQLTTSAFAYAPLTGPWSEMVDGFLFLRKMNPPHEELAGGELRPATADSAKVARAAPSALNSATRPQRVPQRVCTGAADTAGVAVRGVVLDKKTGRSVPYASVSLPGQGVGTVANGEGRFVTSGREAGCGPNQQRRLRYCERDAQKRRHLPYGAAGAGRL